MVGFPYLVRSLACRAAAERGAAVTTSATLSEDLCHGVHGALTAVVAAPRSRGTCTPTTSRPDTALAVDLLQLLAWISPHVPVATKEKAVHAVWGITVADRDALPVSDTLALMDVLTQRASTLSLSALLELCQILARCRARAATQRELTESNAILLNTVIKRLVDAIFDWLPDHGEALIGDSEAALFDALDVNTASRYLGTNRLRQQRRRDNAGWHACGADGETPSWRTRLNRDELMLVVSTVVPRVSVLMSGESDRVAGRGQSLASAPRHVVDDAQVEKLTRCLRQMALVVNFRRLTAARAVESTEWLFFLALLASPVPSWRALASETLLAADVPFGTLGALFHAQVDKDAVGHDLRSVTRALSVRDAEGRALDAFVALLAVPASDPTTVVGAAAVSPLIHDLTSTQAIGVVNMLVRTQPLWATAGKGAAGPTPHRCEPTQCRHAESLFAALVARLQEEAHDASGSLSLPAATLLSYQLVLCHTHLQRLADDPSGPVNPRLRTWVVDALDLSRAALAPLLSEEAATTSTTSSTATNSMYGGRDSVDQILSALKDFLDVVTVFQSVPALATAADYTVVARQIDEVRVLVLTVCTRLAKARQLDRWTLSVGEYVAANVSATMSGDAALEAALQEVRHAFALEAVVLALSAPFPEYQVHNTASTKASAPQSVYHLLTNFRKALHLCLDQHLTLEAIQQHAATRRVSFDVPRFLRALLTQSEREFSHTRDASASTTTTSRSGKANRQTRSPDSTSRADPMESLLASQLLQCTHHLLQIGALQTEESLHTTALLLRTWTASDAVIRGMNWNTRSHVLFELYTLYSAAYPHFHVSKASRVVALECVRAAARLSLSRLGPEPAAQTAADTTSITAALLCISQRWRLACLALSHPVARGKADKYLTIVLNSVPKSVLVLRARRDYTRAGCAPLPESSWAPLELLLTRILSQTPSNPTAIVRAAGQDSLEALGRCAHEDLVVIMEWNVLIMRLCKTSMSVLTAVQAADKTEQRQRVPALGKSISQLARVVDAVTPVLLPSTWNRVRRVLVIYLSVDASISGRARKKTALSRTLVASVRCVWRYVALNGNTGRWATGSTEEKAAPAGELLTRRELAKLFESQDALVSAPDLVAQLAAQLREDMARSSDQDGGALEPPAITDAQLQAKRHDEMTILRTFRSAKASSY